jgi:hypothetical protein
MGDHVYRVMIATYTHQALPSEHATSLNTYLRHSGVVYNLQFIIIIIIMCKIIDTIHGIDKPHILFLYFFGKYNNYSNLKPYTMNVEFF